MIALTQRLSGVTKTTCKMLVFRGDVFLGTIVQLENSVQACDENGRIIEQTPTNRGVDRAVSQMLAILTQYTA